MHKPAVHTNDQRWHHHFEDDGFAVDLVLASRVAVHGEVHEALKQRVMFILETNSGALVDYAVAPRKEETS